MHVGQPVVATLEAERELRAALIFWNMDKHYLADLEAKGIPIVLEPVVRELPADESLNRLPILTRD